MIVSKIRISLILLLINSVGDQISLSIKNNALIGHSNMLK